MGQWKTEEPKTLTHEWRLRVLTLNGLWRKTSLGGSDPTPTDIASWLSTEPVESRRAVWEGLAPEFTKPSALISAIRAMGEEERAQVLGEFAHEMHRHTCAERDSAIQRAEKAEQVAAAERVLRAKAEEERTHAQQLHGLCGGALREAEARAAQAERERDEARSELVGARRNIVSTAGKLHDSRVEAGTLRARVAELEAAAKPAAEFPLAPGSRWEGDVVVDEDDYQIDIGDCGNGMFVRVFSRGAKTQRSAYLADVLALASRAGLLPAQPRWVPVVERLPERGREVIAHCPRWIRWWGTDHTPLDADVTHWLDWTPPPLPWEATEPTTPTVTDPTPAKHDRIDPERLALVCAFIASGDSVVDADDNAGTSLNILRGRATP